MQLQASNPPRRFPITIQVIDSSTRAPLPHAAVVIEPGSMRYQANEIGVVITDSLLRGNYMLYVYAQGYHLYSSRVRNDVETKFLAELCPTGFHLHEIVISKERIQTSESQTLQLKQTLNMEEIERLRGQNITELLTRINGLHMLTSGPTISKPVLRGLHSQRLVMMVGNTRLEGQQWGAEHAPEIDPFSAGRVEVIKGASGVEFGAEAIGGVVRIMPRDYRMKNGIGGELSLNAFSNNRQGVFSLLLDGAHGQNSKLQWRVRTGARKAGDSRTPRYIISNSGMEELNMGADVSYKINPRLSTEMTYSRFETRLGIFIGSHVGNLSDLEMAMQSSQPLVINPFTYEIDRPYQHITHHTVSNRWIYRALNGDEWSYQYALQINQRREFDTDRPFNQALRELDLPTYNLQLYTHTHDVKWKHQLGKRWRGTAGASYMLQYNDASGLLFLIPDFTAHTLGIYLIEKYDSPKWQLEWGARFDYRHQQVQYRDRRRNINNQFDFAMPTGIASATYLLNHHWKIIANASSAWRAPAINELYSDGLHMGIATYERGDSLLKPEQSYLLDVSLKYESADWTMEASMYHNYMHNFIYARPQANPILTVRGAFPLFAFTQTDATLTGTDFTINRRLGSNFLLGTGVSYLYAQDARNDEPLLFMPANRIRTCLQYNRYQLWKLTNIWAELRHSYVGEQTRYVQGTDFVPPPPAYQLWDVTVSFNVKFGKQLLKAGFGVNNLLNTAYRDYLSTFRYFTDDTGRNFILRLSIPFNQ
jgi:iron complex outermembrane receptor protein